MRRSCITMTAVALALGAAGCHNAPRYGTVVAGDPNCPPADGCATPGQCSDEIIAHAPKQRYIVKVPAPCPPEVQGTPQGAPAAPVGAPAPQGQVGFPQGPAGFQQGAMGFPQQPFGFGGQPVGLVTATPFGAAGGNTNTTVSTSQKTRIALTTTTIRISLPWLKLTPFTEAPETTIRISGSQTTQGQQGFGFAQTQGFGVPMGVMPGPVGFGAGVGSLPGAAGSFVQGQVVGAPVGGGVVTGPAPAGAAVGAAVCPPTDPTITPERIQALTKKIEELEAKDAAKKAEAAKKDAAPAPKEKMP